jgi:hypothetical protein
MVITECEAILFSALSPVFKASYRSQVHCSVVEE